jgi:NTE family protein
VAKPLREFTKRDIRTGSSFRGLLPWKSTVEDIAEQYEKHLTPRKLVELPDRPSFVLCATDLSFGANWEFTKRRVGDYQLGYLEPARLAVGQGGGRLVVLPSDLPAHEDPEDGGQVQGGACRD